MEHSAFDFGADVFLFETEMKSLELTKRVEQPGAEISDMLEQWGKEPQGLDETEFSKFSVRSLSILNNHYRGNCGFHSKSTRSN